MKLKTVKRLTGNTATLGESYFSGVIIRYHEGMDEAVLVQSYSPNGEGTEYTKPVVCEITYDETDSAGFEYENHFYHLADFMRDNYGK